MCADLVVKSNELKFEPIVTDSNRFLANNEDLDPDSNYYNELALPDATYPSADEVFNVTKSTQFGFSILHVNCRSIRKNFDDLLSLLNQLRSTSYPYHIRIKRVDKPQLNRGIKHVNSDIQLDLKVL